MSDIPIPFNAPMVLALLDDRKSQTRRIAKITAIMGNRVPVYPPEELIELEDGEFRRGIMHYASTGGLSGPYDIGYAVGDRLWVREAYYQRGHWEPVLGAQTKGGRQKWAFVPVGEVSFDEPAEYRKGRHSGDPATVAWHKRLGRFMPRACSRLTLTVTDVRVERLQDISEADAIAEGLERDPQYSRLWKRGPLSDDQNTVSVTAFPVLAYRSIWEAINGPDAWAANPWVVAVSFTVARGNIDAEVRP